MPKFLPRFWTFSAFISLNNLPSPSLLLLAHQLFLYLPFWSNQITIIGFLHFLKILVLSPLTELFLHSYHPSHFFFPSGLSCYWCSLLHFYILFIEFLSSRICLVSFYNSSLLGKELLMFIDFVLYANWIVFLSVLVAHQISS